MDFLQILEQYGVPIAVAIAYGFFIWKQNKYIQDDMSNDLHQKFNLLKKLTDPIFHPLFFLYRPDILVGHRE